MQQGLFVLVNTNYNLLKGTAAAVFGKYIIARVVQAAYERILVPKHTWRPVRLIVDEPHKPQWS